MQRVPAFTLELKEVGAAVQSDAGIPDPTGVFTSRNPCDDWSEKRGLRTRLDLAGLVRHVLIVAELSGGSSSHRRATEVTPTLRGAPRLLDGAPRSQVSINASA